MKPLATLFYLLAAGLGALHVAYSSTVTGYHRAIAEYRSPSAVIDRTIDRTFELLTFGWYEAPERGVDVGEILNFSTIATANAERTAIGFALLSVIFLAILAWTIRAGSTPGDRADKLNRFALHTLGVALMCLGVGICAPLLTISATQDLPLLGEVVLSHESKSILELIAGLSSDGDWFIAGLILLFSLLVPIAKLSLAVIALIGKTTFAERARSVAHHLGRWSMADVFVAAVLIAFLTARKAPQTEAAIGTGLYFFAAHTLTAILSSQLMQSAEARIKRST
ncbi:MAG: paraquat-inducible protein A [Gammaproteobacteria bacterium]|nr:paraquat-inducible protein A [Gammaproteobacteria bacterium]